MDARSVVPHLRAAKVGLFPLILLALCLAIPAHAQGCSQCAEAVGQTPIRTQTAYRRAIVVLVLAGSTVFGSALIALRRFR